jgi:hypothetical protein
MEDEYGALMSNGI